MFEHFSAQARKAIKYAQEEAAGRKESFLGTEHLLWALVKNSPCQGALLLEKLGVTADRLASQLEFLKLKTEAPPAEAPLPFSPAAGRSLELAREEAALMLHPDIGTGHMLLGLALEAEGKAFSILKAFGIEVGDLRREIERPTGSHRKQTYLTAGKSPQETPILDGLGTDLTELAKAGGLDPVIGRDQEIERLIRILIRRTKNNPVLIGEAGVGKTAIVEGLAQRIVKQATPPLLFSKRLVSLDLGLMIAGTKYRGQFEERFKALMEEVKNTDDTILFIDEIHSIVGTGSSEGSMDAATLFKPPLARGDIQCIGATTLNEYRKYIEKDRALERRFQTILVDEPSEEDSVKILTGLRERYENHHQVIITDGAIERAVTLSSRYLTSRFLPDKAIDLLDEACSAIRLACLRPPGELKEIEKEINHVRTAKIKAANKQRYEEAARIRDREQLLQESLEEATRKWRRREQKNRKKVCGKAIEQVVSNCTGIPTWRMRQDEQEKLKNMEKIIARRVFGQEEAIKSLSQTIRRSRLGFSHPHRPIGSFLFLGPPGVGKTELAKALAEFLFNNQSSLIQLDMSEFSERFSSSRLTGAPPGYVGYQEGSIFEQVRRRPCSVILFDNIDKADPALTGLLLQILDEGRLTDNTGCKIDFRHTVIILTSNLFPHLSIQVGSPTFKGSKEEEKKKLLTNELKKHFSPEFLDRLDDIILFKELKASHLQQIIRQRIEELNTRLKPHEIELSLTSLAEEWLTNHHLNTGARMLYQTIRNQIETRLADLIVTRKLPPGKVVLSLRDDRIVFGDSPNLSPAHLSPAEKGCPVAG